MERNPAAATNNYGYYKDPVNYTSPNSTYGDIYQLTYPFEDELKDKRYQLSSATGAVLQQTQAPQQAQPVPNLQYHQNYAKTDYHQQTYKPNEKPQPVINPYANYNYQNYKDSTQYTPTTGYYDQYKFNMGLGVSPASYGKTGKDTNYHQNYSPGIYPDPKLGASSYCEDTNLVAKSSLGKSTNSSQLSQFPVYPNCYGYPQPASFPNQNYCSYAQGCNDDARMLWDEYQTNRRLMSSYIPPPTTAPPAAVQTPTVPPMPQTNCPLKNNYTDYYGSSAAYHAYHTSEGMRTREKVMYPMNSHVPSDSLYNSRSRCLPVDYKYHQAMSQNMVIPPYDHRYNYIGNEAAQTYDYCSQRQDNGSAYHHPAYGKPGLVNTPVQKHIRSTAAMPNDFCNSQPYYVCNDQMSTAEFQDPYSQQCLRDTRHTMGYNMGVVPGVRNISTSNEMMNKDAIYTQPLEGGYYAHTNAHANQVSLSQSTVCTDKTKSSLGKGQNLREFLSTWNEDEEDGAEKMDESENQLYVQQTNIEVENTSGENHLQFKGSFNTRPKIHVGITVDSNVANNQYINLPDIIIDIEKSKDTDLISHSIGTAQSGNAEKLVVLESVDVPVTDIAQYGNISLLEAPVERLHDLSTVSAPLSEEVVMSTDETQEKVIEDVLMVDAREVPDATPEPLLEVPNDALTNIAENVIESEKIKQDRVEPVKTTLKLKRRKRIVKPKIADRTKIKYRMFGKIIKTKSGKSIRIRKVMKNSMKRRNLSTKKTMPIAATSDHSKDQPKKSPHSLFNPKTLKDICISFFNSEFGRDWLTKEDRASRVVVSDDPSSGELNQQSKPSAIPKLSALCEYALNNFYEEKNILLLNLDDLDSNLYFIECDINENVVNTDGGNLNESDFIELYIDDESEGDAACNNNANDCENDSMMASADVNDSICSGSSIISANDDCNILDDSLAEICLTSDENSRDFSAIHHEEIVPDNLHAFENERLLKYLQNKYIQKSNYLKIFIIDKICKKYRKYILKRRKGQRQQLKDGMTKKLLLSKLKDKFIKRSKQFKIGSCS